MNYSINKIFADSTVNALLDRLYYDIVTQLPEITIPDCFALTGRAAAILQGATDAPLENIVFITDNKDVFTFVQLKLNNYFRAAGAIVFKERVLFYSEGVYIEIWTTNDTLNIVDSSGIYMQHIDDIAEILL